LAKHVIEGISWLKTWELLLDRRRQASAIGLSGLKPSFAGLAGLAAIFVASKHWVAMYDDKLLFFRCILIFLQCQRVQHSGAHSVIVEVELLFIGMY
jgi:hypothetical protein